jgi:hypothetical protein
MSKGKVKRFTVLKENNNYLVERSYLYILPSMPNKIKLLSISADISINLTLKRSLLKTISSNIAIFYNFSTPTRGQFVIS